MKRHKKLMWMSLRSKEKHNPLAVEVPENCFGEPRNIVLLGFDVNRNTEFLCGLGGDGTNAGEAGCQPQDKRAFFGQNVPSITHVA